MNRLEYLLTKLSGTAAHLSSTATKASLDCENEIHYMNLELNLNSLQVILDMLNTELATKPDFVYDINSIENINARLERFKFLKSEQESYEANQLKENTPITSAYQYNEMDTVIFSNDSKLIEETTNNFIILERKLKYVFKVISNASDIETTSKHIEALCSEYLSKLTLDILNRLNKVIDYSYIFDLFINPLDDKEYYQVKIFLRNASYSNKRFEIIITLDD